MKRLATLLLAGGLATASYAQVGDARNDIAIGGFAGVNMSSVSFKNPTIKQGSLLGPNIGGMIRFTCEKYFTCVCAIQAELNFSQLGWKEEIEDESGNTYNRTMQYVQVPLLARLAWGRERKGFQGYIIMGPQMGFFVSEKEHYGGDPWNPENRRNQQYGKAPDRKFDYGISAGAGLEFSNAIGHFQLEARYYYGLADFYDNSKRGVFGRSGHNAITFRLGYLFDLIKTKNPTIK